jgi:hypothetical protein
MRPIVSTAPPGGNGTIIRTGLVGAHSAAEALMDAIAKSAVQRVRRVAEVIAPC